MFLNSVLLFVFYSPKLILWSQQNFTPKLKQQSLFLLPESVITVWLITCVTWFIWSFLDFDLNDRRSGLFSREWRRLWWLSRGSFLTFFPQCSRPLTTVAGQIDHWFSSADKRRGHPTRATQCSNTVAESLLMEDGHRVSGLTVVFGGCQCWTYEIVLRTDGSRPTDY